MFFKNMNERVTTTTTTTTTKLNIYFNNMKI